MGWTYLRGFDFNKWIWSDNVALPRATNNHFYVNTYLLLQIVLYVKADWFSTNTRYSFTFCPKDKFCI